MTATITDHRGQRVVGEIRCWMGRRIVEVETPDGARHLGHLTPDPEPSQGAHAVLFGASTVDGAA